MDPKTILTIIGLVIAIVILLSVINFYAATHPPKLGRYIIPSSLGLEYEDVSFKTSDGLTLRGWFIPSKNNKTGAVIIVGHGYPFSKSDVLPFALFLHDDYNLLYYDFRYFGESQGKYTTVGWKEKEDVKVAINYLKNRKDIDRDKIGAFGFSLSASTFIMAENGFKAIVADSPYASLDNMIKQSYKIFGPFKFPFVILTKILAKIVFGLNTNEISPEESIKELEIPVLLIHGDKDSQIPLKNSEAIYKNSNKSLTELWIVPNADHGASHATNPRKYEERVLDFFGKHLGN